MAEGFGPAGSRRRVRVGGFKPAAATQNRLKPVKEGGGNLFSTGFVWQRRI
jgi:hypothetical protein